MKGVILKSGHQDSEGLLNFYDQDKLLFKSKIALLSLSDFHCLDWIEKMLMFWEYAQLISQSLLLYSSLGEQSLFEKAIIYFFQLVNPSSLLEFKKSSSFAWSVIILILVITGLKYFLMGYILYISSWNKQGQRAVVTIWRWLFKFQVRFTCFFLTSFWAQTILNISEEGSGWVQINTKTITTLFCFLIVGEYLISFLIELQFCDMLPRKSFLSGKNNEMQLLTLAQKMVLQVFQLALKCSMRNKLWTYSVINLMFSCLRIERLLAKLPLYRSKALYLLGYFSTLVLGLHIVFFVGMIVRACCGSINVTMQFIIIIWVFIGLLGTQIVQRMLQKTLFKLATSEKIDDPALLLHKIIFAKELGRYERVPKEETAKYHFTYFFRLIEKNMAGDLLFKSQHRDPLIRIYISKLWFQQFGMCFKVLKMASDILTDPWSKEYTSYILLLNSAQKASYLNARKEAILDFTHYIENQKLLRAVKTQMIQQVEMKTIICKNILNKGCDVGEIFDQAQLAWKSRIKIENKIYTWLKTTPEYWAAPLLVFSTYSLILEYSLTKSKKYQEMYAQRLLKNRKHFENSKIMNENIYQDSNVFLILGGLNGEIKYYSKSIEEICGGEKKFYDGLHVSKLFAPSLQSFYKDLFKKTVEQGEVDFLQKTQKAFFLNKKGHIFEASFFLWINQNILSENVSLNMILRPTISSGEFMLIKKNGDIEGATKDLSCSLGLKIGVSSRITNIKALSEELVAANEAFNLSLLAQEKQDEFGGREIDFDTLKGLKLRYQCRIKSLSDDMPFMNIIFFKKLRTMVVEDELISNFFPQQPEITKRNEKNLKTERDLLISASPRRSEVASRKIAVDHESENGVQDLVSTTITTLRNVEESRDVKELKRAMIKKTHSGLFRVLCLKFYFVVILTLVSQLASMRIFNSTMEDLVIKKDLLNYAQTRAYYACKMPFSIESTYLLSKGIDVYSYYVGGVSLPPADLIRVLYGYYLKLADANNNIIKLLGNLEKNTNYEELFMKDVRIFGSIHDVKDEGFSNFTNFQAVEQFGISVKYLLSLPDPIAPIATAAFLFVRKNTLGDFLTKNQQVTQLFQESVMDQRDELSDFIWLCIILNPVALTTVCLVLNLIIWNQFLKERKYLQAFIKLDKNYISMIAENMKDFKQALLDDRNFEDKKVLKSFWDQSRVLENVTIENHHPRSKSEQIIDLRKTKKKYFLFGIQMGVYITILVGVLLWSFLTTKFSLNIIYKRQSQLQFSNEISETANVDILAMVEMFISNNTLNVSGLPPLNQTKRAVKGLENLVNGVLTEFEEHDGGYNPLIKKIVFEGENCSVYDDALYISYCVSLQRKGVLTSLAALVTYFESFMKTQLALYENMHSPSEGDLIVGLFTTANRMSSATSLLSYIAQRLNGIIDRQLAKSIAETRAKLRFGMIMFTITLIIVSLLIWIQVLSKIKETNNDFKKVLQVFPTKLVASSFLLKNFLDKFSKNNFDL